MKLFEVKDSRGAREFLDVAVRINGPDPVWVRPLDNDIEAVFDPKKNKAFRHGSCIRWVLKSDKGELLGRVAAFVNNKTAKKNPVPTGGMGFFECVEDPKAAKILMDACKEWLKDKGMECMEGPINFGERDKWWGLLVEGFIHPLYGLPYNPRYYQKFFEDYGFKLYFNQYIYHRPVQLPLDEKYQGKADRIARDPGYSFAHLDPAQIEKFTEDFRTVYNKAWARHTGVGEMNSAMARAIMKQLKPIMDPDVIWFGYYNGQPISFFIMLPDINPVIKKLNGQLNWWAKLKFWYYKRQRICRTIYGQAFGVDPKFQGKGIEGAMVMAAAKHVQPLNRYDDFEMNWIGDFNPKMMHIAESVGGKINKRYITYRYMFDPKAPYKRAPMMD